MFYDDTPLDAVGLPLDESIGVGQFAFSVDFEGRVTEYRYDNTAEGGGRLVTKNYYAALANGYEVPVATTLSQLRGNLPGPVVGRVRGCVRFLLACGRTVE